MGKEDAEKKSYFSEEQIQQLRNDYSKIDKSYESLLIAYTSKKFTNEEATEFARHGFARRLKTLAKCIHNVYETCPPDQQARLYSDELSNLGINLQSFVFNVFGCLDNLAWIWVKENDIKKSNGKALGKTGVGFYKDAVQSTYSQAMQKYLKSNRHQKWYKNLENFRHALAHRIPLYVPPYTLNEKEVTEERSLEAQRIQALARHDFDEYERLSERLYSLGTFIPVMTHSFGEKSNQVVFHAQIIADWNTIVEVSRKFLDEF